MMVTLVRTVTYIPSKVGIATVIDPITLPLLSALSFVRAKCWICDPKLKSDPQAKELPAKTPSDSHLSLQLELFSSCLAVPSKGWPRLSLCQAKTSFNLRIERPNLDSRVLFAPPYSY
jgi:hypothetical protein